MKLLVDVANTYARARHAMPELATSHGRPTGGLWGFVRTVDGIRKRYDLQPEDVWLANEGGGRQVRQKLFDGYKADRTPGTIWLPKDYEELMWWSIAYGAHWVSAANAEADDVIFHLASDDPNVTDVIVSRDHDFWPLLATNNIIVDGPSAPPLTRHGFESKHGYDPGLHHKLLWLTGDATDNIAQAVPRVGEVTALKLWRECDWDVLQLLQHPKVAPHKDKVIRNESLVEPMEIDHLHELDREEMGKKDAIALYFWYERFEMTSMMKQLDEELAAGTWR